MLWPVIGPLSEFQVQLLAGDIEAAASGGQEAAPGDGNQSDGNGLLWHQWLWSLKERLWAVLHQTKRSRL